MGNLSISVNGQALKNVELRQVRQDYKLEHAKEVLESQKDGLDTIGITIEDVDYLITGKGINAKAGDAVTIEGQAAGKIAFVEQEENTFGEGFKAGNKPVEGLEGLEQGIMAGMLPMSQGLVRGAMASFNAATSNTHKVVEQVTQGPVIDKKLIEDAAKAISAMFGGDD